MHVRAAHRRHCVGQPGRRAPACDPAVVRGQHFAQQPLPAYDTPTSAPALRFCQTTHPRACRCAAHDQARSRVWTLLDRRFCWFSVDCLCGPKDYDTLLPLNRILCHLDVNYQVQASGLRASRHTTCRWCRELRPLQECSLIDEVTACAKANSICVCNTGASGTCR